MYFDLLKAFGYIERVVKSELIFFGNDLFYITGAQHVLSYHLIKYHWLICVVSAAGKKSGSGSER